MSEAMGPACQVDDFAQMQQEWIGLPMPPGVEYSQFLAATQLIERVLMYNAERALEMQKHKTAVLEALDRIMCSMVAIGERI